MTQNRNTARHAACATHRRPLGGARPGRRPAQHHLRLVGSPWARPAPPAAPADHNRIRRPVRSRGRHHRRFEIPISRRARRTPAGPTMLAGAVLQGAGLGVLALARYGYPVLVVAVMPMAAGEMLYAPIVSAYSPPALAATAAPPTKQPYPSPKTSAPPSARSVASPSSAPQAPSPSGPPAPSSPSSPGQPPWWRHQPQPHQRGRTDRTRRRARQPARAGTVRLIGAASETRGDGLAKVVEVL